MASVATSIPPAAGSLAGLSGSLHTRRHCCKTPAQDEHWRSPVRTTNTRRQRYPSVLLMYHKYYLISWTSAAFSISWYYEFNKITDLSVKYNKIKRFSINHRYIGVIVEKSKQTNKQRLAAYWVKLYPDRKHYLALNTTATSQAPSSRRPQLTSVSARPLSAGHTPSPGWSTPSYSRWSASPRSISGLEHAVL